MRTRSAFRASPRPKCARGSFWLPKPLPPEISRSCQNVLPRSWLSAVLWHRWKTDSRPCRQGEDEIERAAGLLAEAVGRCYQKDSGREEVRIHHYVSLVRTIQKRGSFKSLERN